jgi:CDP-diacylglycerol--glycerol-3-phosphate 3-phosphatidyltransferase
MGPSASRSDRPWLTLSNGLTSMRLAAAPFFYALVVGQAWWAACAVFWLAVVSDLVDGRLARARNETSAFGGTLDHGSDATFVTLGALALAKAGVVPLLLPVLIVAAFIQYVLDSRILMGRELRTSLVGRWNGIFYFVPAGIVVTRETLGFTFPPDGFVMVIGWVLVLSTVCSMVDRLLNVVYVRRRDPAGR